MQDYRSTPGDISGRQPATVTSAPGTALPDSEKAAGRAVPATVGLKPGSPAPQRGRYQQRGAGGVIGRIVTALPGQPLPATPKKGMRYYYLSEPVLSEPPPPIPVRTDS